MTVLQAIFLGIIQGLTEFLPISSSAHLNIMPWLFNWQEIPESFDVALHFGTLLAICIYFFKDWIDLIIGGYKKVVQESEENVQNVATPKRGRGRPKKVVEPIEKKENVNLFDLDNVEENNVLPGFEEEETSIEAKLDNLLPLLFIVSKAK